MKDFFVSVHRLLRLENLAIIVLTLYLTRFFIIKPILEISGASLILHEGEFLLVVIATVLIAAAGYIINDYFDVAIDRINRPHQLIVGRKIKRKTAILLHFLFNSLAMLFVAALTYRVRSIPYAMLFFGTTVLLWFYSAWFKRMFLTGNFIVSLLLALVMWVAWIPELTLCNASLHSIAVSTINLQIIGYSFFAFLISLIREIVKTIEDYEGDKAFGCRTFPVKAGIDNALLLVFILLFLLALLFVGFGWYFFVQSHYLLVGYIALLLFLPVLYVMTIIRKAKTNPRLVSKTSWIIKLITLAGVLSMLILNNRF